LRIATLLIAAALIIQLLPVAMQRPTTLRNLLRIRRDIFLNRLSVDQAWLDAEIALVGMNAPARREYYLRELAANHVEFQRNYLPIGRQLVGIKSQVDALLIADGSNVPAENFASLTHQFSRSEKAFWKAKKKLADLETRQQKRLSKMTGGETPGDAADLESSAPRLLPTYDFVIEAQKNSTELMQTGEALVMTLRDSIELLRNRLRRGIH